MTDCGPEVKLGAFEVVSISWCLIMPLSSWVSSILGLKIRNGDDNLLEPPEKRPRKDPVGLPAVKPRGARNSNASADTGTSASAPPTDYVLEAKKLFLSMGMSLTSMGTSRKKRQDNDD